MRVYTAPEVPTSTFDIMNYFDKNNIKVFLGGGITKCHFWQKDVLQKLYNIGEETVSKLIVFNPRREQFDAADPRPAEDQIKWEHHFLMKCDIFSMYFCNSESVQPICMYELGRYIEVMKHRFPDSWERRIVISIEKGYSRENDVIVQTGLAFGDRMTDIDTNATPERHARKIIAASTWILTD